MAIRKTDEAEPVNGGSRRGPDPSPRSMETLFREIENLEDKITLQLDGMKEAVKLLQDNADKSPTISVVNEDLKGFKDLTNEKFAGIRTRFEDLNKTIDQTTQSGEKNVNTALTSAKELVAQQNTSNVEAASKTERGFSDLIKTLSTLVDTKAESSNRRIDELKEATDKGRGVTESWGKLLAIGGLLIAALAVAIPLMK